MTLIASVSGIRGTIGGEINNNLTPINVVAFAAAYGSWLKIKHRSVTVVVGRDARISGPMVQSLVQMTLVGLGIDVIDIGLSTTPTVEMEVVRKQAQGGIVITASHNPKHWNALKLLNNKGEFINVDEGVQLMQYVKEQSFDFVGVDGLGKISIVSDAISAHIDSIISLPQVNVSAIKSAGFSVVVDGVNSSGGIAVPLLLEQLGVKVHKIYCTPNGEFPHNPEPLEEHLSDLSNEVTAQRADLGIAVDPDVDRLVFIDENGLFFGEEYTLVACADYILKAEKGPIVSNLSSSRALADLANDYNVNYHASAIGELHVVSKMKEVKALIGGEGNGGVILPALHYGRDALVGIALFLSHIANENIRVSKLKERYTSYVMYKKKIDLSSSWNADALLDTIATSFEDARVTTIDGVKIDFDDSWIHLRKSNTEPIIRLYAEAKSQDKIKAKIEKIEAIIAEFVASV
ncbi:MAG: phosphoglucosamine mutase [Flavobacteriaceae bacterium]|nr:phosphoglucosamine mutase [Flavobacteriaceae bacterium]